MHVIEAPNLRPQLTNVFLGGGITGCPDWQSEVVELLHDVPGILLNPRRSGDFSESMADEQITWEYHALRTAETVFFWFPKETMCPITLFELGVFTQRKNVRLIVGTHPEYVRRFDVIKQLELARPEVVVQESILGLVTEFKGSYLAEQEIYSPEAHAKSLHEDEQNEYKRVERIVHDELELVIGHGTITDLHKVLKENYKNLDTRHVTSVLADRRNKDFYLGSDGRLFSPRK
jgi:hypothetical protein